MYIQQFEKIENKPDISTFMNFFGFDYPTAPADLAFLETDWWGFELDKTNPIHRKRVVRDNYNLFYDVKNVFSEAYWDWAYKYDGLYDAWEITNRLENEIPCLESQLKKPLVDYAYDWRKGEYSHKGAQALYVALDQLKNAHSRMERLWDITDKVPDVPDDLLRIWHNLKLTIEIQEQHAEIIAMKPKRERKPKTDEPQILEVNVSWRDTDSFWFMPGDVVEQLKKLDDWRVNVFGLGIVSRISLQKWLREFEFKVLLELLNDGNFRLTGEYESTAVFGNHTNKIISTWNTSAPNGRESILVSN